AKAPCGRATLPTAAAMPTAGATRRIEPRAAAKASFIRGDDMGTRIRLEAGKNSDGIDAWRKQQHDRVRTARGILGTGSDRSGKPCVHPPRVRKVRKRGDESVAGGNVCNSP